ncbi:MAG: cation transporter, partial [Planctomycetota bacterium]
MTNRQLFRVRGMDCASESAQIRRELEKVPGVDALGFDHARGRMVVTGTVAREEIAAAVARTGLRAEPWTDGEESRRVLTV